MNQNVMQQLKLRRSILFFSFLVLTLTLSGCKVTVKPISNQLNPNLEAYTTNLKKWQTFNIDSYDFVFQRICFCTEDVTNPVEVSVQKKQKQSIRKIENYQDVDVDKRDFFLSVDEIFAVVKSAIDENSEIIRVSYDPVYGFPTDVYIDYDQRIADEELSIVASNLKLAPNGVKPLPTSCEAYSTDSYEYSSRYGTTLQVFSQKADALKESVKVCVRSKYMNGCPEFVSISASFENGGFKLVKEVNVVPTLVACTQVITPYARLVDLNVGGLEPDSYPINYYDSKDAATPQASTSFELKTTNISNSYTANLAKWQSQNLKTYDFVFQRTCFCPRENTRPALVSVQNSQKENIRWIETYQEVEADKRAIFLDIDELFALIKSAMDQKAKTINVEYDSTYGFPTNIYIDYDENIADEEVSIRASFLKFGAEAGKPLPTTCEAYATDGYEYNVANTDTSFATLQVLTNQVGKAQVCLRSQHTNGCTDSIEITSVFEKGVFKLVRTSDVLPPIACPAVIAPFARLIDLDVGGLETKTYTIAYYASKDATIPQIQMTIDLKKTSFANCLPIGIKDSTVVSAKMTTDSNGQNIIEKVTVTEALLKISASCQNSILLDEQAKEIRFYNLVGCWGALPEDAAEQLAKQENEIANLKKDFTVIELTCNPSGFPYP